MPRSRVALAALVGALTINACSDGAIPTDVAGRHEAGTVGNPELGSGWIRDPRGNPVFVQFAVENGIAVMEGDMILGPASKIARARGQLQAQLAMIDGSSFRWTGGVVPYTVSTAFWPADLDSILVGLQMVETRAFGVKFRPKNPSDSRWVAFELGTVCNSFVGKQSGAGAQNVNLTLDCLEVPGKVAHEALHALGAFHEQSRCDRNTYVQVVLDNVLEGKEVNFNRLCNGVTDYGPYEEGSIMHYGAYAFSQNGQPTIVSLRGRQIGQRDSLATIDWQTIKAIYPLPTPTAVSGTYNGGGNPQFVWRSVPGATSYAIVRWEDTYFYSPEYGSVHNYGSVGAVAVVSDTALTDWTRVYTGVANCYYDQWWVPEEIYANYSYAILAIFPRGESQWVSLPGGEVFNCGTYGNP
jgi:astacin